MQEQLRNWLLRLEKHADRPWYIPTIALLAGLDLFVVIIPTDGLLVTSALLLPKKWMRLACFVSLGSALGALCLTVAIQYWGHDFLEHLGVGALGSDSWTYWSEVLHRFGWLALVGLAAGPLPLQPGTVVAAVGNVPPSEVFTFILLGRLMKYLLLSWVATHAPNLLSRFWGLKSEVDLLRK